MLNRRKKLALAMTAAAFMSLSPQVAMAQARTSSSDAGIVRIAPETAKKWAGDENLRHGMENVRATLAAGLPAVRSGKASEAQRHAMAKSVNDEIAYIFQNCKFDQNVDAVLHSILLEIIAGADAIADEKNLQDRRQGIKRITRALEEYAARFDHPSWRGLK